MKSWVVALAVALVLAAGPALAGGEGGSSPFSGQKKAPAPGTDPGFDTAARFFALFAQRNIATAWNFGQGAIDFEGRHKGRYVKYWTRNPPDPSAERKVVESLKRVYREIKADLGAESPKAAPNRAPVRDPDALPGLDY